MSFRVMSALFVGCVFASLCPAQQLDTVLHFPDSMGYCANPARVFANPVTKRVYVLSSEGALVFDPALRTKDRYFRGYFYEAQFCSGSNKLYLVGDAELLVVDANDDQLLRRVPVSLPDVPTAVAYSPTSNKLYVGSYDWLGVFDVGADTLLRELDLDDRVTWAGWDSVANRVLLGEEYTVQLLDCAADSIVAGISLGSRRYAYAAGPAARRLYCGGDSVFVLDVDSLAVVAQVALPDAPHAMAWNPVLNRVYCRTYEDIVVLDCAGDTMRAVIPVGFVGSSGTGEVIPGTASGKVYVPVYDPVYGVAVIDAGDTLTGVIPFSGEPYASAFAVGRNELYSGLALDRIAVVDCSADTLAGYMEYPQHVIRGMVFNPAGSKLYLLFPRRDTVLVLDREYQVVRQIPVALKEADLVPVLNPGLNRLYIADAGALQVIDCNRDEVLAEVPMPGLLQAQTAVLVPGANRLYVFPRSGVDVWSYDCLRNTAAPLHVGDEVSCAAFHPWSNRVYFATDSDDSIWMIDPVVDTLAGKLWVGRFHRQDEMLANTDNGRLYFARHASSDKLFTIDVRTNTVLDSTPLADDGDTIFWSRWQNKLYVCNRSSAYIKVFDCGLDTVTAVLSLPCIYAGAMNEATDRLFLGASDGIVVLDCHTDSVVARLSGVPGPRYSAFDPVDRRVFFARRSNAVAVYSDPLVAVEEEPASAMFALLPGPNPVRGQAVFSCRIAAGGPVLLSVYDATGRLVTRLPLTGTGAVRQARWSGTDAQGRQVASGVYHVRLVAAGKQALTKVVFQR